MALNQATLELLVTLDDQASSGMSSLGGALGSVGALAGGAALAGVAALGAAIVGGAKDAQEARLLYASTEQTIASMGNAAGRSADDVVALASSLSDAAGMSLFGDDQIQQSENLLLTFGNIKGATFDLATALSVDLAQALGGAPADQAMMLGKALNDPIKGMSALGKAGLTFSEEQKAAITAMQETGDMAGAQALIIAELNKQVGGQAAAAAKAAGGMVQFKAGLGETFETIGAELLPVLDELGAWLSSPEVQAALKTFATNLANGIRIAAEWISGTLIPAIRDLYNWLAPILGPVLVEVGRALSEDLPRGIERFVSGWNIMKQALSDFKTGYIDPVVRGWNAIVSAIETAYGWFQKIGSAIGSIQIPSWLQGHSPPPLADWFDSIGGAAKSSGDSLGDFIGKLSSGAIGSVKDLFGAGAGANTAAMDAYMAAVRDTGDTMNDALSDLPAAARRAAEAAAAAMLGKESYGSKHADWDPTQAHNIAAAASMPAFSGAASGGSGMTLNITVQGSVTTERDLVRAIRDGLNQIGLQNVSIFSPNVTP